MFMVLIHIYYHVIYLRYGDIVDNTVKENLASSP